MRDTVIFSYRIVDMCAKFLQNIFSSFFRHICNIHFFLKILRGRVKAAKTPPFSGGVNTGLTQQEKEFQAFIVWIVIGPTIRSRIGVCDTLCGVRCCSEKGGLLREERRTEGRLGWIQWGRRKLRTHRGQREFGDSTDWKTHWGQ